MTVWESSNEAKGVMGMAKYDKKAQERIKEILHEFKKGDLKMKGGKTVRKRDQALAIAMDKARKEGDKVPPEKK
jgi:O-phosphoseryl-tRNA(Cys) synthetase